MKETFYFQHDYNARNDPKLQDVLIDMGVDGLGVFWCIIEQLYEQGGFLPLRSCKSIAFALHVDFNIVEHLIMDYDLFENDGQKFWSKSVLIRLERRKEVSEKRKMVALARWKQIAQSQSGGEQQKPTSPMQLHNTPDAIAQTKENEMNKQESKKENAQRFKPPTIEEIKNFISEKGYSVDAESFFAFYESKGWLIGKNKMKNWKMAVVTWAKRNNGNGSFRKKTNSKSVNDEWT